LTQATLIVVLRSGATKHDKPVSLSPGGRRSGGAGRRAGVAPGPPDSSPAGSERQVRVDAGSFQRHPCGGKRHTPEFRDGQL